MKQVHLTSQTAPVCAFFDVDDTLISVKSMFSFQEFWYREKADEAGRSCFEQDMRERFAPGASWAQLNRRYYRHFAGRRVAEVQALGQRWFERLHAREPALFHPRPLAQLREHQRLGHEVVFVSGSFVDLLRPIAHHLGVRHWLATRMAVRDGRYTGEILPPQTIGAGKAQALKAYLRRRGVRAGDCYAYGDDISDLPMLQAVGCPRVVSGGRALVAYAHEQGWPVIDPV